MASLSAAAWLYGAGTFLDTWGMVQAGRGQRIAGERAKVAAEFEAWQAEREAGIAIALSQHQALEERRQGELAASRALAVAAASGGGVSDPTIVTLLANIKGEAVYRANVALWEGESRARSLRLQGAAARVTGAYEQVEGRRAEQGYRIGATGSLLRGGASLYAKYGMGGPGSGSGDAALISTPSWQG